MGCTESAPAHRPLPTVPPGQRTACHGAPSPAEDEDAEAAPGDVKKPAGLAVAGAVDVVSEGSDGISVEDGSVCGAPPPPPPAADAPQSMCPAVARKSSLPPVSIVASPLSLASTPQSQLVETPTLLPWGSGRSSPGQLHGLFGRRRLSCSVVGSPGSSRGYFMCGDSVLGIPDIRVESAMDRYEEVLLRGVHAQDARFLSVPGEAAAVPVESPKKRQSVAASLLERMAKGGMQRQRSATCPASISPRSARGLRKRTFGLGLDRGGSSKFGPPLPAADGPSARDGFPHSPPRRPMTPPCPMTKKTDTPDEGTERLAMTLPAPGSWLADGVADEAAGDAVPDPAELDGFLLSAGSATPPSPAPEAASDEVPVPLLLPLPAAAAVSLERTCSTGPSTVALSAGSPRSARSIARRSNPVQHRPPSSVPEAAAAEEPSAPRRRTESLTTAPVPKGSTTLRPRAEQKKEKRTRPEALRPAAFKKDGRQRRSSAQCPSPPTTHPESPLARLGKKTMSLRSDLGSSTLSVSSPPSSSSVAGRAGPVRTGLRGKAATELPAESPALRLPKTRSSGQRRQSRPLAIR